MPRGRPRKRPQIILLPPPSPEALVEIGTGNFKREEIKARYGYSDQVLDCLIDLHAPKDTLKIKEPKRPREEQQPPPPPPARSQHSNATMRFFVGSVLLMGGLAIGYVEMWLEYEYSKTFGQLLGFLGPVLAGLQIITPTAFKMLWSERLRFEAILIALIFIPTLIFSTYNQI